MANEISDYFINGLSLNNTITDLFLNDFEFNENCLGSWSLCFAINRSITNIESIIINIVVTFGMNEESAQVFFCALKYSKSVKTLKICNAKFYIEGFKQLADCIKNNKSITSIILENLDYLGCTVTFKIIIER